ncbi:MAG TPA: EpsD family peptidyl-prolyl cis-trans isomerase [Burkholderiales bacterium]|nr:EpsD family peptidyl-prolyl cis-trans isomerase [Burkholderiales bacterium]
MLRKTPLWLALGTVLALAACGESDKPNSQTAAKVNAEEITVHQVNAALSQVPAIPEDQQSTAARQVLDRLIDQELLVQKAIDKKLDRDPQVMQSIQAYKRQVLAQAYIEQLSGANTTVSKNEIDAFYEKHPELFSQRRIYKLQEVKIPASANVSRDALTAQLKESGSLGDFVAWLKSQGVKYNISSAIKAAEALPLDMAAKLAALQTAQTAYFTTPMGISIVHVDDIQPQPMNKEQASPFIERYLVNHRKIELARNEVQTLKTAAKIEYVGQFAKAPAAAQPAAVHSTGSTPRTQDDAVKRGLSGL